MKVRCLIGPPGCSKTTTIANRVRKITKTMGPGEAIICSYTRAAAAEAASRDTGLMAENVGTLHHFANRAIGNPPMIRHGDFNDAATGYSFAKTPNGGYLVSRAEVGQCDDDLLSDYQLLRETLTPKDEWSDDVAGFAAAYERYKADAEVIDFTDQLTLALERSPCAPGAPAHIFIDEAQDLTKLQLALARKWAGHSSCESLTLVGDPDQALYEHAGAYPGMFYRVDDREVLKQSYRVPRAVQRVARRWRDKLGTPAAEYLPRDEEGSVAESPASLDEPRLLMELIEREIGRGGTVMLIVSCGYMLHGQPRKRGCPSVTAALDDWGIPYWNPWRKREERWNPEIPPEDPALAIGTAHSFKGAGADTVILAPDISPAGAMQYDSGDPGPIIRQFYVALTRARHRLILLDPSGPDHVEINISD